MGEIPQMCDRGYNIGTQTVLLARMPPLIQVGDFKPKSDVSDIAANLY